MGMLLDEFFWTLHFVHELIHNDCLVVMRVWPRRDPHLVLHDNAAEPEGGRLGLGAVPFGGGHQASLEPGAAPLAYSQSQDKPYRRSSRAEPTPGQKDPSLTHITQNKQDNFIDEPDNE